MFESVKQETGEGGMKYAASLLISLGVHALLICALILVPLVFFNVLQTHELLTFLIEPPQPPPAPPVPTPPARASSAVRQGTVVTDYGAPREIPQGIPVPDDADLTMVSPVLALPQIPTGSFGQGGSIGGSISTLIPEAVKLPAPPPPPPSRQPIRIAALEPSKLIFKVNPVYPVLAVKAHVQGNVILEAVVDEEGNVSKLKVLSGHPLLVDAAVQAVMQWKYSPTVLSGEPVSVIATVTVIFRLN